MKIVENKVELRHQRSDVSASLQKKMLDLTGLYLVQLEEREEWSAPMQPSRNELLPAEEEEDDDWTSTVRGCLS